MNRKAGNKRPPPSYVDGKLRDPSIAKKQTAPKQRDAFMRLVKKATTQHSS